MCHAVMIIGRCKLSAAILTHMEIEPSAKAAAIIPIKCGPLNAKSGMQKPTTLGSALLVGEKCND